MRSSNRFIVSMPRLAPAEFQALWISQQPTIYAKRVSPWQINATQLHLFVVHATVPVTGWDMANEHGCDKKRCEPDRTRKLLKEAGIRTTSVRRDVFAYLLHRGLPLSHQEILNRMGNYNRVTLYRTLNTLTDAGLVHAVQGLDGVWRFCAHDPEHRGCPGNHPHFLCLSCGRMICLSDQKLPYVEVPADIEVKGKQLLVYGRCASCVRSSRSQDPNETRI